LRVSRRQFLDICRHSATITALGGGYMATLENALANPSGPEVVWLSGSSCTGCSISFLNRFSSAAPQTTADVLISAINLTYHPQLMSAAGETAALVADSAYQRGGYILAVEGGVPTAFGGATCFAWSLNGVDVTFQQAVQKMASKAALILSVGTCASFGGIPAAPPNPTGVRSVSAATLKKTINIPGCPTHPDWVVWVIANLLTNTRMELDTYSRPVGLFAKTVHERCPRRDKGEAHTYGRDGQCLEEMGCLGPKTKANCPLIGWNSAANWCVDANSQCLGCTEPNFPVAGFRSRRDD
jgi:hydrogenase small subunit